MLCHFSHQLPKHHLEEKSPSETDQQRHVGRSALNVLMRLFNRTWGDRFVARWAAVGRAFPRPEQEGAHEHIAEARHFFGSNPGGTTLKCEKLKFLMESRNHWGLYGNDLVH